MAISIITNSLFLISCRLANKSDKIDTLSEYELTEMMNLEEVVNVNMIPTKVQVRGRGAEGDWVRARERGERERGERERGRERGRERERGGGREKGERERVNNPSQ